MACEEFLLLSKWSLWTEYVEWSELCYVNNTSKSFALWVVINLRFQDVKEIVTNIFQEEKTSQKVLWNPHIIITYYTTSQH